MKQIIIRSFYKLTPVDTKDLTVILSKHTTIFNSCHDQTPNCKTYSFKYKTHLLSHKKKRNDGRDPVSNGESDADLQSLKLFRKTQLITD